MENKILYSDSYNISDNEIYYQIAKNIYILRVEKGLSIRNLSLMADVSERYLSYIESGHKHASIPTIVRIAHALNVSFEELLATGRDADG